MNLVDEYFSSMTSPHIAVMRSFHNYLLHALEVNKSISKYEDLNIRVNNFLNKSRSVNKFLVYPEYYENFTASNVWDFDTNDNNGYPVNAVAEFHNRDRFVFVVSSSEWDYWDIELAPYDFPAVAYSRMEVESWFTWAIFWFIKWFPVHRDGLTTILNSCVNVDVALDLMREKLNGDKPWSFGPARMHEPNFALWHERTKDKKMNDWILHWIT